MAVVVEEEAEVDALRGGGGDDDRASRSQCRDAAHGGGHGGAHGGVGQSHRSLRERRQSRIARSGELVRGHVLWDDCVQVLVADVVLEAGVTAPDLKEHYNGRGHFPRLRWLASPF